MNIRSPERRMHLMYSNLSSNPG